MAIENPTNNRSSCSSMSKLELKSLARMDMKKMSQSELYSLSRYSSNIQTIENVVIPNIDSDHQPTTTTTTTKTPSKIFAFSNRRGHRRRISASQNDDVDSQLTENKFILNFLDKLVAEGEVNDSDSNIRRDEGGVQKRKRRRKSNSEEFEGLGVISVDGEKIDLKFLARGAHGAFEAELKRMTEGMVREDDFLGFLKGLEGRWGSTRKRRRYVDAADFVKALPINWKILLSLRPRARRPSLYCRRFVSPSDMHFKSCKEVAFYLKSQFATNDDNPIEGAMCQVDLESVARVPKSSVSASEMDVLGANDLHTIRRLNSDTLTGKKLIIENSLKRKPVVAQKWLSSPTSGNSPVNGQASSSLPKPSNEPKNNSKVQRNLKTRCMWCLTEFFHEPVVAEALVSSSGFICPQGKENISGNLEDTLSKLYKHAYK